VFRALALATVVAGVSLLGGCALSPFSLLSPTECMARVMYFESNRSSAEGMLAVGTVVMNRMHDPKFPSTVCGVVGQRNQFADGVLWKPLKEGKSLALARQVAERVLAGARHPGVRKAKFFHTEGYSFPYTNMHYVLVAGGNAFYEKW
jgi:spore germination cell wall hydrolase CwlJ-like protein